MQKSSSGHWTPAMVVANVGRVRLSGQRWMRQIEWSTLDMSDSTANVGRTRFSVQRTDRAIRLRIYSNWIESKQKAFIKQE